VQYRWRPGGPEALGTFTTRGSSAKSSRIVSTLRPHVAANSESLKCLSFSKPVLLVSSFVGM
jgi:hypothetical protein